MDHNTCFEAAGTRLLEALALYRRREHTGAHYLAGLAAECVLRAYYLRIKPESEEYYAKHDIEHLARLSGLAAYLPRDHPLAWEMRHAVGAAIGELKTRWRNTHKYRDDEALGRWLHSEARVDDRARPADRVRVSAHDVLEAALEVVTLGRLAWLRPRSS